MAFTDEGLSALTEVFYRLLLSTSHRRVTTMGMICKMFIKHFLEDESTTEEDKGDLKLKLEKIEGFTRNAGGVGHPLGLLEQIVFRDISYGRKTDTMYNYGFKRKAFTLGSAIFKIQQVEEEILDIFAELSLKYGLEPPLSYEGILGETPLKENKIGVRKSWGG